MKKVFLILFVSLFGLFSQANEGPDAAETIGQKQKLDMFKLLFQSSPESQCKVNLNYTTFEYLADPDPYFCCGWRYVTNVAIELQVMNHTVWTSKLEISENKRGEYTDKKKSLDTAVQSLLQFKNPQISEELYQQAKDFDCIK